MTHQEAVKKYGELYDFQKDNPNDLISWSGPINCKGPMLFSFDGGETVYNVYGGSAKELTEEQVRIFEKENPRLAGILVR